MQWKTYHQVGLRLHRKKKLATGSVKLLYRFTPLPSLRKKRLPGTLFVNHMIQRLTQTCARDSGYWTKFIRMGDDFDNEASTEMDRCYQSSTDPLVTIL